jgi:hypothetical protein
MVLGGNMLRHYKVVIYLHLNEDDADFIVPLIEGNLQEGEALEYCHIEEWIPKEKKFLS